MGKIIRRLLFSYGGYIKMTKNERVIRRSVKACYIKLNNLLKQLIHIQQLFIFPIQTSAQHMNFNRVSSEFKFTKYSFNEP